MHVTSLHSNKHQTDTAARWRRGSVSFKARIPLSRTEDKHVTFWTNTNYWSPIVACRRSVTSQSNSQAVRSRSGTQLEDFELEESHSAIHTETFWITYHKLVDSWNFSWEFQLATSWPSSANQL
ncbi:hypothetical protein B0H11DRAFT_1903741 [Mycena galericulata]|nr:hypothetical protein B0H11DRAFT_1903741 [Mycena galericulata]